MVIIDNLTAELLDQRVLFCFIW